MALINCKECGQQVYNKAATCPGCGATIRRKSGCGSLILLGIFGFIALGMLGHCASQMGGGTTNNTAGQHTAPDKEATPSPPPEPGAQWQYSHDTDPMTGKVTHFAIVPSTNTVRFDFPYNETQHGILTIRQHPRHGKDVIFAIEAGQILCHSYEDCVVLVRFDDAAPKRFWATGPVDNGTTTAFLRNYAGFVSEMKKAKVVRISTDIYQEGSPVFEFNVEGFDEAKYLPPAEAKK